MAILSWIVDIFNKAYCANYFVLIFPLVFYYFNFYSYFVRPWRVLLMYSFCVFMWGTDTPLIPINPKIERTLWVLCKARRETLQTTKEAKDEKMEMATPPRQMFGDYCRRTDTDQISWGFQLVNPMTWYKNYVLQVELSKWASPYGPTQKIIGLRP